MRVKFAGELMNSEKGPLPALNALAEIRKIFMNLIKWLFKVASESKGSFSYVPAKVLLGQLT